VFSKRSDFGSLQQADSLGSKSLLMMPGTSGARLSATPGTSVTTSDVAGGT